MASPPCSCCKRVTAATRRGVSGNRTLGRLPLYSFHTSPNTAAGTLGDVVANSGSLTGSSFGELTCLIFLLLFFLLLFFLVAGLPSAGFPSTGFPSVDGESRTQYKTPVTRPFSSRVCSLIK